MGATASSIYGTLVLQASSGKHKSSGKPASKHASPHTSAAQRQHLTQSSHPAAASHAASGAAGDKPRAHQPRPSDATQGLHGTDVDRPAAKRPRSSASAQAPPDNGFNGNVAGAKRLRPGMSAKVLREVEAEAKLQAQLAKKLKLRNVRNLSPAALLMWQSSLVLQGGAEQWVN